MEDGHILVTGSAGFIGFHLSTLLLSKGEKVIGVDNLSEYYDPTLKKKRLALLEENANYKHWVVDISDRSELEPVFSGKKISVVIHLAAQAGVRYSIEAPEEYVSANLVGFFNILDLSTVNQVRHFLFASTSSVYGANKSMPFSESHRTDNPLSFYAATKKSNEILAHSYSHIHKIPITGFRFFTVYGPWGRPDMALFKFADAINRGEAIPIFNYGKMQRDFTYVVDLVTAIYNLIDAVPIERSDNSNAELSDTASSSVAPYQILNIGNSEPVELMQMIRILETALKKTAEKEFLPMQQGDVPKTWADVSLLQSLTGNSPSTSLEKGIAAFVEWYLEYRPSSPQ